MSANDTLSELEAKVDDDLNEVLGEKVAVGGGGGGSPEPTPAAPPAGNPFREAELTREGAQGGKDEVDNEVRGNKVLRFFSNLIDYSSKYAKTVDMI